MTETTTDFLTVRELAHALRCSTQTVYNLIREGAPHIVLCRKKLFRLGEVESWLQHRQQVRPWKPKRRLGRPPKKA